MIKLTDEGYSFHTFQLTKSLNPEEYRDIKDTIFSHAKIKKYRAYSENGCIISEQYKRLGVLIKLYDNGLKPPHIELRVNPRFVCEDYDYLGIFLCTQANVETVKNSIDEILFSIHCPYRFDEMTLSRIDLCVNLELDDSVVSDLYLRCVRKCFVPNPFVRVRFPSVEKEKNKHSFRAVSSESDFTIYDKLFQARDERLLEDDRSYPSALIRFEVALKRPAILRQLKQFFHDAIPSNSDLLGHFGLQSKLILQKYISDFFPNGYYLTYQEAKKMILSSQHKCKIRMRMLSLLENVRFCDHLNNAIAQLKSEFKLTDYQIRVVLKAFNELDLNPVTLPNKSFYIGINGIYRLFESAEGSRNV